MAISPLASYGFCLQSICLGAVVGATRIRAYLGRLAGSIPPGPAREKQREKVRAQTQAEATFSSIAHEFCEKRKRDGSKAWAASTAARSEYLISLLTVSFGRMPIALIEPADVLAAVRKIERNGKLESACRTLQLAPHVFVRPGELRQADWSEIDLEGALWTIPASKTKMRKGHLVPLSRQTLAILNDVHSLTGPSGYVFPSIRTKSRPMSGNTINAGLRRLGYATDEMTAHGFRAMASTLLNESSKWNPDAIERALAHGDSDKVRAACHRGAHCQEHIKMAQW